MSDKNSGRVMRSAGFTKSLFHGAVQNTGFTRFWFLTMAILAFGFAITMPLGCMSPPTRYFTFFSINPQVLAHRYNARIANTTGELLYDEQRLDKDLVVLPDVYRIGMSGVCREVFNSTEIRCTKQFPQSLDLGSIIDADIRAAALPNSTASRLQTFWDSLTQNDTQPIMQNKNRRATFVQASAGLTITSLVIAPIGLCVVVLMYLLERPGYPTIATGLALLDAAFMVPAATLWIFASAQYAADIESALGGQTAGNAPFWNGTAQYPPSNGLAMFAGVALAKIVVLPVMALISLLLVALFIIFIFITIALMLVVLQCLLATCGACDNGRRDPEPQYFGSVFPTPDWANS